MSLKGHPNIVDLDELFFHQRDKKEAGFVLCFEYASKGDLHHYLGDLKVDIQTKKKSGVDYNFIRNVLI